ncbi:hypothetical protein, partial [Catenulispora yoronensis]|uniref:hypothetical protein n=1 Tax=Catenulispora yoronensis TaxID=450799 RepID=UPI0031E20E22
MRQALPDDLPALRTLAHQALIHDPDAAAIVDLFWKSAADNCRIIADSPHTPTGPIRPDETPPTTPPTAPSTTPPTPQGFALASLRPARDNHPTTGHI